jgi:hypothetical protein
VRPAQTLRHYRPGPEAAPQGQARTRARRLARGVNLVWNCCNELSQKVLAREHRFIGAAELQRYLAGASTTSGDWRGAAPAARGAA